MGQSYETRSDSGRCSVSPNSEMILRSEPPTTVKVGVDEADISLDGEEVLRRPTIFG